MCLTYLVCCIIVSWYIFNYMETRKMQVNAIPFTFSDRPKYFPSYNCHGACHRNVFNFTKNILISNCSYMLLAWDKYPACGQARPQQHCGTYSVFIRIFGMQFVWMKERKVPVWQIYVSQRSIFMTGVHRVCRRMVPLLEGVW